jgi:predicted lipoprotein with Yx(FWY)xxD motif
MRRIVLTLAGTLAGAAVLAACGAAGPSNTAPAGTGAAASPGTTISTGMTSLGTVLTDSKGMTLYFFLPEKNATIGACTGGCLTLWPAVVVTGTPTAPSGVTGMLGTVPVMVNGAAAAELTYNGWPLHTFASDAAAGQTNGQGIMGKWFVAMPSTSASSTGSGSGTAPTPMPAGASTPTPGGYGY